MCPSCYLKLKLTFLRTLFMIDGEGRRVWGTGRKRPLKKNECLGILVTPYTKWGKLCCIERLFSTLESESNFSCGKQSWEHILLWDKGNSYKWLRNLCGIMWVKGPLPWKSFLPLTGMINSTSYSIWEKSSWKKLGWFACANCQNDEWNRCGPVGREVGEGWHKYIGSPHFTSSSYPRHVDRTMSRANQNWVHFLNCICNLQTIIK